MRNRNERRKTKRRTLRKARQRARRMALAHAILWPERNAENPAKCSGPCCGNPRRHFGTPTRAETLLRDVSDLMCGAFLGGADE